jgi:hypothetical protein
MDSQQRYFYCLAQDKLLHSCFVCELFDSAFHGFFFWFETCLSRWMPSTILPLTIQVRRLYNNQLSDPLRRERWTGSSSIHKNGSMSPTCHSWRPASTSLGTRLQRAKSILGPVSLSRNNQQYLVAPLRGSHLMIAFRCFTKNLTWNHGVSAKDDHTLRTRSRRQ